MSMEDNTDVLNQFKESIILLHGLSDSHVFDSLKEKKIRDVFVMEGRPSLESSKASCKALIDRQIVPTLIADNMAGFLFYKNLIKEVWISYQTSDDEGALCSIGALILGVLGKRHHIPVYLYPAKQKMALVGKEREIFFFNGEKVAPKDIKGYVPLAEWLPKQYTTKIFQENEV